MSESENRPADRLQQPGKLGRREFLKMFGKAVVLGMAPAGMPRQTDWLGSFLSLLKKFRERNMPVSPEVNKDALTVPERLRRALDDILVIDFGKQNPDGELEAVEQELNRLLPTTINFSEGKNFPPALQIEDLPQLEKFESELRERLLKMKNHGTVVISAISKTMSFLSGDNPTTESLINNINFKPIITGGETPFSSTGGTVSRQSTSHGPVLVAEAGVDFVFDELDTILRNSNQTIINLSLQAGVLEASQEIAYGKKINQTVRVSTIARVLHEKSGELGLSGIDISSLSFAYSTFVLPAEIQPLANQGLDLTAPNISIKLTIPRGSEGEDQVVTIPLTGEFSGVLFQAIEQESTTGSSIVTVTREDAVMSTMSLVIGDSGREIELQAREGDPTESDFDYQWVDSESDKLVLQGAFHPENSERKENLKRLQELANAHPNKFFVVALGNYGDTILESDIANLPSNVLLVGQVLHTGVDPEEGSYPYGDTMGMPPQVIFVDTVSVGLDDEDLGSTFATADMSLVVGLIYQEMMEQRNQASDDGHSARQPLVQPLTAQEIYDTLAEKGLVRSEKWSKSSDSIDLVDVAILDGKKVRKWLVGNFSD